MALQIPNAPQLEADPYARSRTGFNDILSVFKEQRALKQNAKMMADNFEKDMRMEMYKGQIERGIRVEIGKQTHAQDMEKLQVTTGIENFNIMHKNMNDRTEALKKQFNSLDIVYNTLSKEYIQKPLITSYFDQQTGAAVIKASISMRGKEVELSEAELEDYLIETSRLTIVTDFIEKWQKGDNISEETTPTRIGRGNTGQEFIKSLIDGNGDAIKSVLDGAVTHNKKDAATTKEVDARIKAYNDLRQGIDVTIQGGGQTKMGNWSFNKEKGKLITSRYGGFASTEIDFLNNNVLQVIDKMRSVENGLGDGVQKEELDVIKLLAGQFDLMLNEYIRSQTTEGAMPLTTKEFFDSGNYYFNPNNGFAIEQRSSPPRSTTQTTESNLYEAFK